MVKFIELTIAGTDEKFLVSADKITSISNIDNKCFVETGYDVRKDTGIGFYVKESYNHIANLLFDVYRCESN